MSAEPLPARRDDLPQFDVVEAVTPGAATVCAECRAAIANVYYEAGGRVICPRCRGQLDAAKRSSGAGRFLRAAGLGLVAAAAGAGIYYAILALTGYEIGLVALVVGFMVGKAVHVGSRGRGGRTYQLLAVALTYVAIVSTYIPFIVKGFDEQQLAALSDSTAARPDVAEQPGADLTTQNAAASADAAPAPRVTDSTRVTVQRASLGLAVATLVVLLLIAAAAPVMAGVSNIIGMLIIFFALVQAWRMNRRVEIVVSGPYRIGAAVGGLEPGAAGV